MITKLPLKSILLKLFLSKWLQTIYTRLNKLFNKTSYSTQMQAVTRQKNWVMLGQMQGAIVSCYVLIR